MLEFAQRLKPAHCRQLVSRARPGPLAKRPAPAIHLLQVQQQALGNQVVQQMLRSGEIQAKLTVKPPNDKYEQEADHVAEHVMRMSEQQLVSSGPLSISGSCPTYEEENLRRQPIEEEEEEELLQTKEISGPNAETTPNLESSINAIRGGGQPLPESFQNSIEPLFGHDFSQVRLHTDREAVRAANLLNASAFTISHNIAFNAGQYAPNTISGKKLLLHELTHVVQQTQNGSGRSRISSYPNGLVQLKQITLKIVKYPGSNQDPGTITRTANEIYNQCTPSIDVNSTVHNATPAEKSDDLEGDNLRFFTYTHFLLGHNVDEVLARAGATGNNQVPVALVPGIILGAMTGFAGYTSDGICAISNLTRQSHVGAHEMGHFYELIHVADPDRLMFDDANTVGTARGLTTRECQTVDSRI